MKRSVSFSLIACMLLTAVHPSAQDMVTVSPFTSGPYIEPEYQGLPENPSRKPIIRSLHITTDIKYRYATTLVFSRVVNPANRAGQATFSVILPENAFISDFFMEIEGKIYKAHVEKHEKASEVYEDAVKAGQYAGHVGLESRDSRKFTMSVSIGARGNVSFFLAYEELLTRHLGLYSHVLNIDPQQLVEDMSVSVNIEEPTAITHLDVPELLMGNEVVPENVKQNSLAIIKEKGPNNKIIIWAPTLDQQKELSISGVSGQFIVRYDVDRQKDSQQILVNAGYFVHFFAPDNLPVLNKHAVFVLDFSGSMSGPKLQQLKDAMAEITSDLRPNDYFSIVIFHEFIEVWSPTNIYFTGLEYAWLLPRRVKESTPKTLDHTFIIKASDENINLALLYLKNYTDFGGTNIMGGLRTALELVNIGSDHWINESDPPQPVVMFLTDGEPNLEERNKNTIVKRTTQLNTHGYPIYCLAFGYDADFLFMRQLCLSNHGFARTIYEAADAGAQLEDFFQSISSPLLSNVTFSYLPDKVDTSSSTKIDFRVAFNGSEIVVAGKLRSLGTDKNDNSSLTIGELTGITADGFNKYPITVDVVKSHENKSPGFLEKTWVYVTIQQLLERADSLEDGDEKDKVKEKAFKLSTKYSLVTELTSLVVVRPNENDTIINTEQVKPDAYSGGVHDIENSEKTQDSAPDYGEDNPTLILQNNFEEPEDFGPEMQPGLSYNAEPNDNILPQTYVVITEIVLQKIDLNDIKWLQQYLDNPSLPSNITVSVEDQHYNLDLSGVEDSFGSCTVENMKGECHHFQFCPLNVFQDDVSAFFPFQCQIRDNYLGVCCPMFIS